MTLLKYHIQITRDLWNGQVLEVPVLHRKEGVHNKLISYT
jgi:hypothetical protein